MGIDAGAVGIVCSAWFYPTTAYEVEFPDCGREGVKRFLLLDGEARPVDAAEPEGLRECFAGSVGYRAWGRSGGYCGAGPTFQPTG